MLRAFSSLPERNEFSIHQKIRSSLVTFRIRYFSKAASWEGHGAVNCRIIGVMNFKSTEATGVSVLSLGGCFYRAESKRLFLLVFSSLVKVIKC